MKSWPSPSIPNLPGRAPRVLVRDTATGSQLPAAQGDTATVYVCGITPYDATHMGHAATYVTFDLLGRVLRDSGVAVSFVQNITDIDDPLLERAARDGLDWRDLAVREIDLFREDMQALAVIAPDAYLGAVECIPGFIAPIEALVARGAAYPVAASDARLEGACDYYFDVTSDPTFGSVGHYDDATMLALSAERGGDPDRAGKRGPLDPLLWRAARIGEPEWDGASLGPGRPGWHIECACIAMDRLGIPIDVQGGGSDLIFPHHEMSASHAKVLAQEETFARAYVHQGMVGLDGEKMSKSKGNLVLVSALRRSGTDPMAIRLALLEHHHLDDWMWTDEVLEQGVQRLRRWREALAAGRGPDADQTVREIRVALAEDLDSPRALAAVDRWACRALRDGGTDPDASRLLRSAVDALLGIRL
ncbi:MAG: cysteine--1-D-myo-inosityl 2-amino-2-deoxy-alpha-D-glucopyranoside ligase [Intrasporangium sp.]|uniref:cysteine--1-D-myo-inosityl 2-amino-2-deoxy-alpha-D-glucopyranoside ligase n=1 Tax=Intrasporangium sp. TaxID=1925024 RepID=UPI002648BFA2|nr:cysteine--1-D-myo-inosityl 2-amino-2-deoxy-alpha-D-glucopyranoside ligase [Intrasporangium sp.]MDN5794664.1 cysteine--1-D-myo-inosityl 2-amino-2-deoxy-alpha-D-glucopyranoside ligase [Intrasporangium sp.]